MHEISVSVCIPVFETEMYLAQCLRSVLMQDFDGFEVIIVSDASRAKDSSGHSAKKITKLIQKEYRAYRKKNKLSPVNITFIENRQNRGIIEVRRTLVNKACGTYITMLDSDDVLEQGALKALYSAAVKKTEDTIDIVQGSSTAGMFDKHGTFFPSKENRYAKINIGRLNGHEIFHEWSFDGTVSGVLWAKLIKRSLYLTAYENIPYTECNMAEDLLLFFFISLNAKSYLGIQDKVYLYRIFGGLSSSRKIDSLDRWKKICSSSSVFSVISTWLSEHPQEAELITKEELAFIKHLTSIYLSNNLKQMKEAVIPELQEEAYRMLCDYWGDHFVKTIEEAVQRKSGIVPRTENSPCSAPNSAAKE